MTRIFFTATLCLGIGSAVMAQGGKNAKPAEFQLKTKADSIGYAIGVDIANNLAKQGIEYSPDALAQAMKDVQAGQAKMDAVASQNVLMKMQSDMRAKADADRKAKAGTNLAKANAFLADNKSKPGVVSLPSGLQYIVLQPGTGKQPTAADKVTTHYHGTLLDGTVFDSSVNRGQPATFPVGGVIQAWQEMLVLMKEGQKVRLFCPPGLAYGERGSGPSIGPNELLIFEIELIKVE